MCHRFDRALFCTATCYVYFPEGASFLRNAQVVDKAAGINTIVFDKTGTVTTQLEKELYYHGKHLSVDDRKLIHALAFQSGPLLSTAIEKTLGRTKSGR